MSKRTSNYERKDSKKPDMKTTPPSSVTVSPASTTSSLQDLGDIFERTVVVDSDSIGDEFSGHERRAEAEAAEAAEAEAEAAEAAAQQPSSQGQRQRQRHRQRAAATVQVYGVLPDIRADVLRAPALGHHDGNMRSSGSGSGSRSGSRSGSESRSGNESGNMGGKGRKTTIKRNARRVASSKRKLISVRRRTATKSKRTRRTRVRRATRRN